MNGKAFSIMTNDEAHKLAFYLAADDEEWSYTVAPFNPQKHTGSGSSVSNDARAMRARSWSNEVEEPNTLDDSVFYVVEVFNEEDRFLGPL